MTDDLFPEGSAVVPESGLPASVEQPAVPAFFGASGRLTAIRGMESYSAAQLGLTPPRLQLIQKIDRPDDVGRPSQWKIGKEVLPEPEIVILKAHPGRRFDEGEGRDARTICASTDGRVPHPSIARPRTESCDVCPYAPWRAGPGGGRVRPPCDQTHNFLIVVPALQNKPAWLICAKTAMKPTREFLKAFYQHAEETGATQFCDFFIKLSSEPQQRQGGGVTYYTPVFTVLPQKPEPSELYAAMTTQVLEADLEYLPMVTGSLDVEDVSQASAAREVMDDGSDDGSVPF